MGHLHEEEEGVRRITHRDTLALANRVSDIERFWLPTQGDFRGRSTALTTFNAKGMSYQRSLLEFANGKRKTTYQVHIELAVAGYAGQDKKSYEERIQWFQQQGPDHGL